MQTPMVVYLKTVTLIVRGTNDRCMPRALAIHRPHSDGHEAMLSNSKKYKDSVFTVNLYHDSLFICNPLRYVEGYENCVRVDLYVEHHDYDVLDFLLEETSDPDLISASSDEYCSEDESEDTDGMRFDHLEQLKIYLANYGVANGYQLWYAKNDWKLMTYPPLRLEGLPFELKYDHLPNYTIGSSNSFEWRKIIFGMITSMGIRHAKTYTLRGRFSTKLGKSPDFVETNYEVLESLLRELNLNTSVRTTMKSDRWIQDLSLTGKLLQPFGQGLMWSIGSEKELWDLRKHQTGKEIREEEISKVLGPWRLKKEEMKTEEWIFPHFWRLTEGTKHGGHQPSTNMRGGGISFLTFLFIKACGSVSLKFRIVFKFCLMLLDLSLNFENEYVALTTTQLQYGGNAIDLTLTTVPR
ncbi:hypothetical protein Tco_0970611 [Tanacetum coccineum]